MVVLRDVDVELIEELVEEVLVVVTVLFVVDVLVEVDILVD